MTERYGSYPPDEPVIGGSVPTAPPRQPGPPAGYVPAPGAPRYDEDDWDDDDGWDDDGYDDEDPYYDDEYYGEAPARQPLFYLFVAIAILVGAAAIVALFALVRDDGGTEEASTPGPVQFRVSVEAPKNGDRVNIGQDVDVNVRATSTDPIARFELLVNGQVADQVTATPPSSGSIYIQVLKTRFERKGEYSLSVRVIAETGEQTTSDVIKVSAVEDIGDRPVSVRGKVVAAATLRIGPSEQSESAGTLNAGQDVTITGKTRNGEWLLLDVQGAGRWAPAAAIEPLDSLDLVPVREPTPTPVPTNTPTREPSPTATPSVTPTPTVNANAPDFVPQNAVLIDDGNGLRVTIANISPNSFSGSLVVRAEGVDAVSASQAFNVTLPANGTTTVEFELATRVTAQKTVVVRVDPENAIKEANEDNNTASIPLTPLAEPPAIVITDPVVTPNSVSVTVQNSGGDMPSSEVIVRLALGGETTQQAKTIALAKNQTSGFTVARPQGSGTARVTVWVNGTQMAALDVPIGP